MIYETHSHYDDSKFDEDRHALITSLPGAGIGRVIDAGSSTSSLTVIRGLIERYDFVFAASGLHPEDIKEAGGEDFEAVRALADHEKCLAIGEIGLDYYWDKDNPEQQRYWFAMQMDLAREKNLPVIVHSRDAAEDTVDLLKEYGGDPAGVMHCFSYSKEIAAQVLDLGMYIGVGGVVTFKNARKLKEVVQYTPIDRILVETDCPYMAPEPYRGKRNSSLYLPRVIETIAELKGLTPQEVEAATWDNAVRLFG